MEVSRLRLRLLIALAATALPGCSWIRRDAPTAPEAVPVATEAPSPAAGEAVEPKDQPIIEPQVERREVHRTRIDTEDFEIGAYVGILSIEDFESNAVFGARLAYN